MCTVAIAAALLVALPAADASSSVTPRIVGGAGTGNPGWVAFLNITFAGGDALCGGELISKRWLLTAAHCVTQESSTTAVAPEAVTGWVGLDSLSAADTTPGDAIDQVVVDPAYDPITLDGDVAVLHLSQPSDAEPVALGGPDDPAVGSRPTVLGWGVTDVLTEAVSDSLLQTTAPVLDPARCTQLDSGFNVAGEICAGGVVGHDSCNGDSGGPLAFSVNSVTGGSLVGTVDYGWGTCADGQPAVYQRVTTGPVASFLAAHVPTSQISAPRAIATGSAVTLAAGASGLPSPSYAWDLDSDGKFDDATGPTAGLQPVFPTSVAVRATGSDGEVAKRRATIVPRPGPVAVTAPREIREGSTLVLKVVPLIGGTGRVDAAVSSDDAPWGGLNPGGSVAWVENAVTDLSLSLNRDDVWHEPWTLKVTLTTTGLSLVTPKRLEVRITDPDKPRLGLPSVRRSGARTLIAAVQPPGSGKLTLAGMRGKRVLERKTIFVHGAAPRSVGLRFSRADQRRLRGAKPLIKATWRSTIVPGIEASRFARGVRLAPLTP